MTFGYHADIRGNTSSAGIHENARSLLSYLISERETERVVLVTNGSMNPLTGFTRNQEGPYCGSVIVLEELSSNRLDLEQQARRNLYADLVWWITLGSKILYR